MSAIRLGAAANVRDFRSLLDALSSSENHKIDIEALQDEFGRFRVWSGNLGVLQKGHSSLDYRLRDSPLLSSNVLKLLKELEENLHAACDIVQGNRLPYEQQLKSEDADQDGDDDFFSEDEDEDENSESDAPKTEISMRFGEIVDIIDNLYKISVRIRAPTARIRSLKAASYQPKDSETGVNIFDQYAVFDLQHAQELVRHLRLPHLSTGEAVQDNEVLIQRLARAITLRRRQFQYWRRHRDKLGVSTLSEEPQALPSVERPGTLRHDTLEVNPDIGPFAVVFKEAPSQRTGRTILSGTEATHHHQSLDDIVDSKSVTSYAVTVKDLTGKGIDLPPPPQAADGERDFECPYCFIICPARYGKGRPWRTHVLQDLQPYMCTYPECQSPDQLFRSRRDWIEHESSHRKAWRCPEHPNAVFKYPSGLEDHLKASHQDSIPENQLASVVKVGETSTVDMRQACPICYAPANTEGMGSLQNHIANHLERIAAFALPMATGDDSDGASLQASRGRTETTDMGSESHTSGYSQSWEHDRNSISVEGPHDDEWVKSPTENIQPLSVNSPQGLSELLVNKVPDDSGQRLDLLFSQVSPDSDDSSESDIGDGGSELEEHTAEREAFRSYLLTLPGAQSVRFYRRYGSWSGNINFKDGDFAVTAMEVFDKERYPRVRLRQKVVKKETVKFSVLQQQQTKEAPVRKESGHTQPTNSDIPPIGQSTEKQSEQEAFPSLESTNKEPSGHMLPVLTVAEIPNLRSLYRLGELLQGGQSYVPSDAYNQLISFCRYDITRLKTDAIVNSANHRLGASKNQSNLNNMIHKAAGPELDTECARMGRLRTSQCVLTSGYSLPSTHIIHVARPTYSTDKGMGQYNALTEAYRSALRLAFTSELKTVAFCCLGTGGVGFPPRLACRIALQEVREFLDAHPKHPFDRIIFCVYTALDHKAYSDHLPLFFPPTNEDLENVATDSSTQRLSDWTAQLHEAFNQVEEVEKQHYHFRRKALGIPQEDIPDDLSRAWYALFSLWKFSRRFHEQPKKIEARSLEDVNLLCSVILAMCGSVTEIFELAKGKESLGQPSHQVIWDDYNDHMQDYHGLNVVELISICREFAEAVEGHITRDETQPAGIRTLRIRLGSWLVKQTGKGEKSVHDHFEEVMLLRAFQRDAMVPGKSGTVKLHQIPTLAGLYQSGELERKPSQVIPSVRFNDIVGLAREDITRMEVDVLVNSTNPQFSGNGLLDSTVFRRGGPRMEEQCMSFGTCQIGDVKITGGHALPAKYVLHAIPPQIYRGDTKMILRQIYRNVLAKASALKATSIAFPAIGTGVLNYPPKESAEVAIEEVKRYLEFRDPSDTIERIIFVAYSSTDNIVYRSLIPIYFPPADIPHSSQPEAIPIPAKSFTRPPRTLFGTLNDAFRNIGLRNQSVSPKKRPLEAVEKKALISFEVHAESCQICSRIPEVYAEGGNLCSEGLQHAMMLLDCFCMMPDQSIFSTSSSGQPSVEIDVTSRYPLSLELLSTVEKSLRDPSRIKPFITPNQSWPVQLRPENEIETIPPGVTIYNAEIEIPSRKEQPVELAFASAYKWSGPADGWAAIHTEEAAIRIYPGRFQILTQGPQQRELLSLDINLLTIIRRYTATDIIIENVRMDDEEHEHHATRYMLRGRSPVDGEMLLERLRHAAKSGTSGQEEKKYPYAEEEPLYYEQPSLAQQSASGQPEEFSLPSVPTHNPGDIPLAVDPASQAAEFRQNTTQSDNTDRLAHHVLTHVEARPPNSMIYEQALMNTMNQAADNVTKAFERLASLDLVERVPGLDRTWAATNLRDTRDARELLRSYKGLLQAGSVHEDKGKGKAPVREEDIEG